jgi:hypothetical protein
LKYLFKWKIKDDLGNWKYRRKRIRAETELEAWVHFFIWAGGADAEDFILMRYRCKNLQEGIEYINEYVSLTEMKDIFTNFMALGMIPKMENLDIKEIT